ncbi:histidine kinase [Dyadobacter subterraneus]|uniref:Histidine kinase n=1 Tax=Dyadobacter subterraneus TaxID=2773304 RepID=A0ABR9WIJ3_9BACT|nr:histidine kinase [Dyadobacter subterraneus]MBE9465320.1 histidine kinase [Dyadobacter subterraneus]
MEETKKKPLRMNGTSLEGRDFSNMNLEGADFSFSSLEGINFDGSNLRGAKIRFASLENATFRNADLTNADLSFSSLTDADMTGAKIEGANFSFSSQGKSFKWQDFKLIGLIQSQSWVGTLVAVIIGALMLYGASAIIYFTLEILYTSNPVQVKLNQYLIAQNVICGVLIVLTAQNMAVWLDSMIKNLFLRHLVLSIAVCIVFFSINTGMYYGFGQKIFRAMVAQSPEQIRQSGAWYWYAIGPLVIANVFYYLNRQGRQLSRKISEQEYQLLNLEKLKTRAELDALQARINPHFLYNALNSIASLVHEDPDKAEEMTLLLSKLFRYTTGRKNNDYFDSIKNELEMVQTYLQVEKVRFGDRLQFGVEVTNQELNNLQVPKFILQPIVENAIKHGISKLADQGKIIVKIYEENGWLNLCVHDNGPLFSDTMGAGYGIRSIQDKLKLLYGEDASLELHNDPVKSVNISIRKSAIEASEEKTQ